MSVLPIVLWPDPRLSAQCAPVDAVTSEIETLAQDMLDTMYDAPGRGLAAPQVGVLARMFVMDATWKDGRPDPLVFVNPEILDASGDPATGQEACLSVPGVAADVTRPGRVHLVWTALNGARMSQVFTGFAAACVQHELDHLDGTVIFDHLDTATRAALEAEYAA